MGGADIAALLASSSLGRGLSEAELASILRISSQRRITTGQMLFLQGDPAPCFYLLLSGAVRVYKSAPDGREYTLHLIRPGQMFAEAAIFRSDGYPASATAMDDSLVLGVPRSGFTELVRGSPQLALKMIAALSSFVRQLNEQVGDLSLRGVPARLAVYVLRAAAEEGADTFNLPTTKVELARRLGTISETLSRNLKRLRQQRLIEVSGSKITIIDRDGLQAVADGEAPPAP
jgi:CRP/FNR family transcriptional regulator, dissimilatory nitrate respiration regulator